jgi:Zn-dependent protease
MPVDPSRLRGRYGDAKVAIAGPLMNVFLALLSLVLYTVVRGVGGGAWTHGTSMDEPLYSNTLLFFRLGLMLNVVLALFNLVPIRPLDGWRILCDISPSYDRLWQTENAQLGGMIAFMALFYFGSPYIWDFGSGIAWDALRWSVHTFAAGSKSPAM